MIGESLRAVLRRHGFATDWVRDGRAADAVLVDLGLPHKRGLDVKIGDDRSHTVRGVGHYAGEPKGG